MIKALLNLLPIKWQHNLRIWNMKRHRNAVIEQWEKEGKPLPPPHTIKQLAIEHYQKNTRFPHWLRQVLTWEIW